MDKVIKVEVKSVYGNELIYIRSDHARYINQLTGKVTIDKYDIADLKHLGFEIEYIAPQPKE